MRIKAQSHFDTSCHLLLRTTLFLPASNSKSPPAFLIQPVSAWLLTTCLTCNRSFSMSSPFNDAYVECDRTLWGAETPSRAITSTTAFQIFLLQTALAPLGSTCFLPCNTPLIKVSCTPGAETHDMLLPFNSAGGRPVLRREKANSLLVVRTLNGWKL